MFSVPRPLIVGLGVVPPALMILTEHPWMGAATFAAVVAAGLLHSSIETQARRNREIPPASEGPVRFLADDDAEAEDDAARRHGDGLIHYPPRRLPL